MLLDETQRKQLEAAGVDEKDLAELMELMLKLVPHGKPSFEFVFFAYLLRRIKRLEVREEQRHALIGYVHQ